MTINRSSHKLNNFTVNFAPQWLDKGHLITMIYQHPVCQFGLNLEYLLPISDLKPMTYQLENRALEWEVL